MTDVAIALIAWLLGLLTPQIVETISRRYRRPELMHSIALELDELRFKLLMVIHNLRWTQGRLDPQFVQRAADLARNYSGAMASHPSRGAAIEMGSYTGEQLAEANRMARDPGRVMSPKRYSVPFLSSRLEAVSILPSELQRRLFELLARLDFYNTTIDTLDKNLALTFTPGLSAENWQAIQVNNHDALMSLDGSGMQILEHIEAMMPMLGWRTEQAPRRADQPDTQGAASRGRDK